MDFYENSEAEFVDGELIQSYNGFVRKVPGGYVRAIRTYSGFIKIVRRPISFQMPFTESKLIHVSSSQNGSVGFDDALKTKDDVTVVANSKVDYSYRPINDDVSLRKFFTKVNAKKNIDVIISDIVKLIVINSEVAKIKNGFSVNPNNIPSWLNPIIKHKIASYFYKISNDYGIKIEQIYNCDFNEPKAITDAETKRKEQTILNNIELEKAKNNERIAQISARAKGYEQLVVSMYNYAGLYKAYQKFHLSTDQICELLKRQFTKSNATIIEGSGIGLDSLVGAVLNGFKDYAKKQYDTTAITNTESDINYHSDDVIDVNYQDNDDKTNQKKFN